MDPPTVSVTSDQGGHTPLTPPLRDPEPSWAVMAQYRQSTTHSAQLADRLLHLSFDGARLTNRTEEINRTCRMIEGRASSSAYHLPPQVERSFSSPSTRGTRASGGRWPSWHTDQAPSNWNAFLYVNHYMNVAREHGYVLNPGEAQPGEEPDSEEMD